MWIDCAVDPGFGGREEMKLLASTRAGDVKEALVLCGLAREFDASEPGVERLRPVTATGDRRQHDVCRIVIQVAG